MDRIIIRNLSAETVIGTYAKERARTQKLVINVAMSCELRRAGVSDRLADTVNYKTIKNEIMKFAEGSSCRLIEAVAEGIAAICLAQKGVVSVKVTVDKPGALSSAESVAVEIERP